MPATEAQVRANQANAARSTGPKTEEGKARSRANSYKHGLTGAGVVMPEEDAAEVDRLTKALRDDMKPPGAAGEILVREIAMMSVRMERSFKQETAALTDRVRKVMDEFEPPEGVDDESAEKLRVEAGTIALFDPSKEACLARQYEAAARRCFFRALSDLRQLNKQTTAADPVVGGRASRESLGSSLSARELTREFDAMQAEFAQLSPAKPSRAVTPTDFPAMGDRFDVPIAIGKRR